MKEKYEEKVFDSKNLKFIKISKSLINDYLIMINNPNINKFLSLKNRIVSYEDEEKWIDNKLNNNSIIFSIIEKVTNNFVGNIEVMEVHDNIAEIGIVITESMQGKHYGTESLKRFIEYCLYDFNFDNVSLSVYSHNLKAIHCYEKLGFSEYKREKCVGKYNDLYIDDIYMIYNNEEEL